MVDEQPKKIGLVWPMIIITALALPVVVTIVMIANAPHGNGIDMLFHIVKTLTYAFAIGIVEIGAAFPIRQWRRKDMTGESHHFHDGTKIVEKWYYGQPPRLPNVTNYQTDPLALPSAQRLMYGAMMGQNGQGYVERRVPQELMPPDAEAEDDDWPAAPWDLPAEATDGRNDVPPPVGWTGEMRL